MGACWRGTSRRGQPRPGNRYELLSCAIGGHALVGTDAATVAGADRALVMEVDGARWHRCLRCDGWMPRPAPAEPARDRVPERGEIDLPLRGPLLRDRYVLRLIAVDRAIHVVVLTVLAVVIFLFIGHRNGLRHDYDEIMSALTGGPNKSDELTGLLGYFRHLFLIKPAHLYEAGLLVIGYAVLEGTEMVGLWLAKRWAEYLTFVATVLLVPFEVYEMAESFGTLKLVTFLVNVAIAVYLLAAKRLFGVRGGHAAEHRRRVELGGWAAVDRATPEPVG
ncbi:MAG TPA: DUF2127 domain-containing protein [Acidimicrobiales bacterium]|nr:DUF2127 domain-containing protein [Acidimicrobiales bacterium]